MKIVTDQRGLYAIKNGYFWPFDKYFDLKTPGFWWKRTSINYPDCWTHDRSRAEAWYSILNPKKAVVILTSNDKLAAREKQEYKKIMGSR